MLEGVLFCGKRQSRVIFREFVSGRRVLFLVVGSGFTHGILEIEGYRLWTPKNLEPAVIMEGERV